MIQLSHIEKINYVYLNIDSGFNEFWLGTRSNQNALSTGKWINKLWFIHYMNINQ